MATKKTNEFKKVALESLSPKALKQLAALLVQEHLDNDDMAYETGRNLVNEVFQSKEFQAQFRPLIEAEVQKRLPKLVKDCTSEIYIGF